MRLFRRNRRLSWLVLGALGAQLLISFGHHHSHTGAHAVAAHVASCKPNEQTQCPSDHDEDEHHCAICWALSLAGRVVLPQPASIDWPITLPKAFEHSPSVISLCGGETIKFQARAPPTTHVTL